MSARQPPATLIQLKRLTKTYGKGDAAFQALRGVDLSIDKGEFVAVMGPSGSGKSTLMNLLGCLDTPTSGSYLYDGIPVETLNADQRSLLRRHALGFIFQGFNLLARTSALENVELPMLYRGIGVRERHERAREALASVGLPGKMRNTPAELSGGQQQRVAIARAIVTEPSTLFADEPTGNLDEDTGESVLGLLLELTRGAGKTLLMATHAPEIAKQADQVLHLVHGKLLND